jgi:hypothetical protein
MGCDLAATVLEMNACDEVHYNFGATAEDA